jgi:non-specific serine/threonine protein kinase
MAGGLALSTWFGVRALHDRDEARERAALAQAVNNFLTEDLLGRGNPAQSGRADETLMAAAEAAEAGIDRRLGNEPMEAGAIYLSLARAFDSRSAPDAARNAYDHAIAAFGRAGAPGHADAIIARLHEASMEVVSGQPGSMARARAEIAAARPEVAALGPRRAEAEVWLAAGGAMLQMLGGDVRAAQAGFKQAADLAETMQGVFDEGTRLTLRQREAFTYLRLGEWDQGGALVDDLLRRRLALNGALHTSTLQLEMNQAQVRIATGRAAAALPDLNRVYPAYVTVFGPDHAMTLQLLATRAEAFGHLARYDDALADEMTIYRRAAAKLGDHSYFALGTLADAANSRCKGGHAAQGLDTARTAFEGARAAFGPANALTQTAAADLAFCLILSKQYAQAVPLLNAVDRQSLAELTMDPSYGAQLDLMRAAAAFGMGDHVLGQTLLHKAAPVLDRNEADPYMRDWAKKLASSQPS